MLLDNVDIQYVRPYKAVTDALSIDALKRCFNHLKLKHPVSFIFMSDDELLEVNRDVLQHDYYTDVITFNYDDEDIEYNEILISVDRLIDNANLLKTTLHQEIHRVCIHGLLHLAGYDDQTSEDKTKMTQLENYYLDLFCST